MRDIINPHKNCGRDAQLAALQADSARMGWPMGELYEQTKKGNETDAAVGSIRKPLKSVVRAMWLFNLAPTDGTALLKRKAIEKHIRTTHKNGGVFREAATGMQSDDPGDLVTMTNRSSKMITDYAKGAAGQSRIGRPTKPRTDKELDTMRRIWESRKVKTVADAIGKIEAKGIADVNKNELYRLFGRRNSEND